MNNTPAVFSFESHKVRSVFHNNEAWFVARDICNALGLPNMAMATKRLDDDEKGVTQIDTLGGSQKTTIVNESGLYSLILRSDKPEAKRFKKWVGAARLQGLSLFMPSYMNRLLQSRGFIRSWSICKPRLTSRAAPRIRDNTDYATWEVTKFIEAKYGRGVSAQIYKQFGTLQEIRNPFIATVMKDAALIRAANIKVVKNKTTDFMIEHFPGEIRSADTRWNGKGNEPVDPTNPDEGMIMFPHKGEIKAYYVPKGIAETFSRSPYVGKARAGNTVNRMMKPDSFTMAGAMFN